MNISDWIGIIFSTAALILSIISLTISINNNKRNLKVTLFEKRYELFKQLEEITRGFVSGDLEVNDKALDKYIEIRDKVVFLFDHDVHDYLLLVINNFTEINRYHYGEKKDENYHRLWEWFMYQVAEKREMRKIFSKYLDLRNYGLIKRKRIKEPNKVTKSEFWS